MPNSFYTLLLLALIFCHMLLMLWKSRKDVHMLQLNSYRNKRYAKWLGKNLITTWQFILPSRAREKKPLVFTPRATRLYITDLLLLTCSYMLVAYLAWPLTTTHLLFAILSLTIILLCSPLLLILSNFLLWPLESSITHWYFNDAKKRLRNLANLKIIGITGSFGKTTTKYALNEILKQKYTTLMPPGSFNTPMGIAKIIRTQLKPTHEILVAELSAKQKGDIAELCDLVKPQFGIITSIGKQHLETFGSLENIKRTKNELIECLPNNGVAFFNMDDPICQELAALTNKKKIYYGINAVNLDYRAHDIRVTSDGSEFTVSTNNGEQATFITKLLGLHNIYNILAAIAAASQIGVALKDMVYPIRQLHPIEHRLELKKTADNITIIDDAFNSNPVGSKMALEVLAQINGGKKIIVTPGMIELGAEEDALNKQFGIYIADVCDYVILVGQKQTEAILAGLKEKHFTENNIYVARDFFEANRHLRTIIKPSDVVLFENDLPDSYKK